MLRGGRSAWASLALLIVLVVGAASLSVETSPKPVSAEAGLRSALVATLTSPNFTEKITTVGQNGLVSHETLISDGPNRVEDEMSNNRVPSDDNGQTITIGSVSFWKSQGSHRWQMGVSDEFANYLVDSGPSALFHATSIRIAGSTGSTRSTYLANLPEPVLTNFFGVQVHLRNKVTVVVDNGRLLSEDAVTYALSGKGPSAKWVMTGRELTTFSDFGTSPTVVAPRTYQQSP